MELEEMGALPFRILNEVQAIKKQTTTYDGGSELPIFQNYCGQDFQFSDLEEDRRLVS